MKRVREKAQRESWPGTVLMFVEGEAKAQKNCLIHPPHADARHRKEPDETTGQLRCSDIGVNTSYISAFNIAEKQTTLAVL